MNNLFLKNIHEEICSHLKNGIKNISTYRRAIFTYNKK